MKYLFYFVVGMAIVAATASADEGNGMINVKSKHDVATTADRLEMVLKEKGMKVFARIDHAKGAKNAGMELRPTQLVIFGNPKVGTPLMKCAQSVAIDLPQKALIWVDGSKDVWLTYNDPAHLQARHKIQGCDEVLKKVSGALGKISAAATAE